MDMFDNLVQIVVRSGETGEVLHTHEQHNAISDDFICPRARIYDYPHADNNLGYPYLFLLPDGPDWATFVWDRTNPWAPYCTTANRTGDQNNGCYTLYGGKTYQGYANGKHKFFYSWAGLPQDLQLKAIGMTGLQMDAYAGLNFGIQDAPTTFVPETLVVIPNALLVRGRNSVNGVPTTTPDVLEISYYLSVVGAN